MRASIRNRWAPRGVVPSALLALVACGGGGGGATPTGGPAPTARVVGVTGVAPPTEAWEALATVAGDGTVRPADPAVTVRTEGEARALVDADGAPTGGLRFEGAGPRRWVRTGPIDPARVDRVVVELGWARGDAAEPETLRAVLLRGGEVQRVLPTAFLDEATASDATRTLHLPPAARHDAPYDELWLALSGGSRFVDLHAVHLGRTLPRGWLDPMARTQTLDGVTLPGVPLFAGQTLELEFPEPAPGGSGAPGDGPRGAVRMHLAGRLPVPPNTRVELLRPDGTAGSHLTLHERPSDVPPLEPGDWVASFGALHGRQRIRLTSDDPRFGLCLVPRLHRELADPPLVLLVTSDTHRADHLGVAPDGVGVRTPALDALARAGTLFEDCRATTHITNPSHVALLTGVHPRDTGVVDNVTPLADVAPTLAEAFRAAGWTTMAAVSASHLAPERSGLGQGFERYLAPEVGGGEAIDAPGTVLRWLDQHPGEPIFAWVHVFDAHAPYTPPPTFDGAYWDSAEDPRDPALPAPPRVPSWASGVRDLRYLAAQYRAEVSSLDANLAPLLEEARARGAWIAFTADHGEHLGVTDGVFDHRHLDRGGVAVPLVLQGPGVAEGARRADPVEQLDLARTLLDLAGVEAPDLPGRDLLADERPADAPRFYLARHGEAAAVERAGWMAVLHLVPEEAREAPFARPLHTLELFDLTVDPECGQDVAARFPERAAELRERLVRWLLRARAERWGTARAAGATEASELAALGYGGGGVREGAWFDPDCDCPRCVAAR